MSRRARWWGYCRERGQNVSREVVGAVVGVGVDRVELAGRCAGEGGKGV